MEPEKRWCVVGGVDKGGILVRHGQALSSAEADKRLEHGAIVRQVQLVGDRLSFQRLSGEGPDTGWVSVKLKDKVLMEMPAPVLEPKAKGALDICDPREDGASVGCIAFYYPGRETDWDRHFGSSFLGNFYHLGEKALEVKMNGRNYTFENAEAAFQALKFKEDAHRFEKLDGNAAFKLKRKLAGQEDWTYGGFGNNWLGMWHVLHKKYEPGSHLASKLLETGDAFLLEHNERHGRDKIWSDNLDGSGQNWLGLQLMLIRDELQKRSGPGSWTAWLRQRLNLKDGTALPSSDGKLQAAIEEAAQKVCMHFLGPGS